MANQIQISFNVNGKTQTAMVEKIGKEEKIEGSRLIQFKGGKAHFNRFSKQWEVLFFSNTPEGKALVKTLNATHYIR